jgi:hypothetical protein
MDSGNDPALTDRERHLIEDSLRADGDHRLARTVLWGAVFAVGLLGFAAFYLESPTLAFLAGTLFVVVTMVERMTVAYRIRRYQALVAKLVRPRRPEPDDAGRESPTEEG